MSNVKRFKEFMKIPRQIPAIIPPGTKYIDGVPQHNLPSGYKRVRDHIAGYKLVPAKVEENVISKVATAIAKKTTSNLPKTPEVARLTAQKSGDIEKIGRAIATGATIVGGAAATKKVKDLKDKKEKVEESIVGAALGGLAGGLAGGPIGAVAGAYVGHKIGQRAAKNPSYLDALALSKTADLLDKRRAKKAIQQGQQRFVPTATSRFLRAKAAAKSGGAYTISPDASEPVQGFADKKTSATPAKKRPTLKVVPKTPQAASVMNPEHQAGHPGHGIVPEPIEQTTAGKAAAAKRRTAQLAVSAAIRAAEKQGKTSIKSSQFDKPGARQKKERVSSSTILVPEEKGK